MDDLWKRNGGSVDRQKRRKALLFAFMGAGLARVGLAAEPRSGDSPGATDQAAVVALGDSGKIRQVVGAAMLKRLGAPMVITQGAQLQPGDRIETGPDGEVIVDLTDGRLAVRPSSQLTIDFEAIRENQPQRRRRQVVTLSVGALRYATLASSPSQRSSAVHPRFDTRIVTIGVRGTDIDLVVQPENFKDADREYAPGAYLQVTEGAAQMVSKLTQESVDVAAGEQAVALDSILRPRAFGQPVPPSVTLLARPVVGIFGRRTLDATLR